MTGQYHCYHTLYEKGQQWERLTPQNTAAGTGKGRQHRMEKPYVNEQQKVQGTAQALKYSQDKARNFESSLWRLGKIKSSLEEIQVEAGNDDCRLE